jgi:hypothetical protein
LFHQNRKDRAKLTFERVSYSETGIGIYQHETEFRGYLSVVCKCEDDLHDVLDSFLDIEFRRSPFSALRQEFEVQSI